MNAHKKMQREVARMLEEAKSRGLLDKLSKAHAEGAQHSIHRINLVQLAHMHMVLKSALANGQHIKISRN